MRIASPPTTHSCFYGVDTPERSKLMAANHSVEEMAELIGVDSLAFLSIDGLYRAAGEPGRDSTTRSSATPASPATTRPASPTARARCGRTSSRCCSRTRDGGRRPRRPRHPDHRRLARAWAPRWRSPVLPPAPASSSSPARAARSRRSTTASAPPAGRRRSSRSTSPRVTCVDPLGPAIHQRHGRLDGLAACAAELGVLTPTPHLDPAVLARVMAVNLHANQRLIRSLDPLLRASDAGRAVFLTDRAGEPRPAVLGRLRGQQGGAGGAGHGVGRRGRPDHAPEGQPRRSRADADPPARPGLPGRGAGRPAGPGGRGVTPTSDANARVGP